MARFINDDAKVRTGGRNAVKLGIAELQEKIWKHLCKTHSDMDEEDPNVVPTDANAYMPLLDTYDDEKMEKDIKFANYVENCIVDKKYIGAKYTGDSLLGFHTLDNGLTFFGIMGGSDWSWAMFSIFYYDGKRIRAYTPIRGNMVNTDFKSALGLEGEYDDTDEEKVQEKYEKLGIYSEPSDSDSVGAQIFGRDPEDESWEEMYLKKYDLTPDTVSYNFDAMLEEIKARIIVS